MNIFFAGRKDGLGARLLPILNAARLAATFGADFRFTWPPYPQQHGARNSRSEELFDKAFADEAKVPFYVREDFWASSLSPRPPGYTRVDQVPLHSFQALLDTFRPSFIACDIEGGESTLFRGLNLTGVTKILVELHQKVIGRRGMKRVFDTLSQKGFHYDQWHSSGSVVLFSHVTR